MSKTADSANNYYVYQLRVDGESDPFYIGKGKDRRAYSHLYPSSLKSKSQKNHKIKKALANQKTILVEFLKSALSENDAFMWEWFYIAEFGRKDLHFGPLLNLTDGGDGNSSGMQATTATKRKMSEQRVGDKNHFFGKTHSPETKIKQSIAKKGRPGTPLSQDAKDKLSVINTGKKHSLETREKLSNINSLRFKGRKVYCNLDGIIIRPDSGSIIPDGYYEWSARWGFIDKDMRKKYPIELKHNGWTINA
jgi:group I intron endonuclease